MKKVDLKYLDFVAANPGATSSDVAKAWNISKITTASRLSTMYAHGLLSRERVELPRGMEYRYSVADDHQKVVPPELEKKIDVAAKAGRIVMPEAQPESLYVQVKNEMARIKQEPDAALLSLVNKFVSSLTEEIVSRLRPSLIEKLTQEIGGMTEEITRAIPRKEKARLKRVLVCGCLDRQGQMLKKEYDGMLEIDWVTVEESADVWRNKARNAFAVLVLADFVSHKHIQMIEETGAIPEIHKGGYTKLRDRLIELSIN